MNTDIETIYEAANQIKRMDKEISNLKELLQAHKELIELLEEEHKKMIYVLTENYNYWNIDRSWLAKANELRNKIKSLEMNL